MEIIFILLLILVIILISVSIIFYKKISYNDKLLIETNEKINSINKQVDILTSNVNVLLENDDTLIDATINDSIKNDNIESIKNDNDDINCVDKSNDNGNDNDNDNDNVIESKIKNISINNIPSIIDMLGSINNHVVLVNDEQSIKSNDSISYKQPDEISIKSTSSNKEKSIHKDEQIDEHKNDQTDDKVDKKQDSQTPTDYTEIIQYITEHNDIQQTRINDLKSFIVRYHLNIIDPNILYYKKADMYNKIKNIVMNKE